MAQEYRVQIAVDASRAVEGTREFQRTMADVSGAADKVAKDLDRASKNSDKYTSALGAGRGELEDYRDLLREVQGALSVSTRLFDTYARDIATVSVQFQDVADSARQFMQTLRELQELTAEPIKVKVALQETESADKDVVKDIASPTVTETEAISVVRIVPELQVAPANEAEFVNDMQEVVDNLPEVPEETIEASVQLAFALDDPDVTAVERDLREATETVSSPPPTTVPVEIMPEAVVAEIDDSPVATAVREAFAERVEVSQMVDVVADAQAQGIDAAEALLDRAFAPLVERDPLQAVQPVEVDASASVRGLDEVMDAFDAAGEGAERFAQTVTTLPAAELRVDTEQFELDLREATDVHPGAVAVPLEADTSAFAADVADVAATQLPEVLATIGADPSGYYATIEDIEGTALLPSTVPVEANTQPYETALAEAVGMQPEAVVVPVEADTRPLEARLSVAEQLMGGFVLDPVPLDADIAPLEAKLSTAEQRLAGVTLDPVTVDADFSEVENAQNAVLSLKDFVAEASQEISGDVQSVAESLDFVINSLRQMGEAGQNAFANLLAQDLEKARESGELTAETLEKLQFQLLQVASTNFAPVFEQIIDTLKEFDRSGVASTALLDDLRNRIVQVVEAAAMLGNTTLTSWANELKLAFDQVVSKLKETQDTARETSEQMDARISAMVQRSMELQQAQFNEAAAYDAASESAKRYTEAIDTNQIDELGRSFEAQSDELRNLDDAIENAIHTFQDLADTKEWLDSKFEDGTITLQDYKERLELLEDAERKLTKEVEAAGREREREIEATQRLIDKYDPLGAATRKLADEQDRLNAAMEAGLLTQEEAIRSTLGLAVARQKLIDSAGGGGGRPPTPPDQPPDNPLNAADEAARGLLQVAGVSSGIVVIKEAIDAASEFEAALVLLQNQTGATDEEMAQFSDTMAEFAERTGKSELETVVSGLAAAQRGFRETAEAIHVVTAAGRIADATFSDLRGSTEALAQIMSAFGIAAEEAADTADILTIASHGSAETLQIIATTAGRIGPELQQAGLSVEDYAIAIGTLAETAGGSRGVMKAMSGLTALVQKLSNVTPELVTKFHDLGIELNSQTIANEGLGSVLQEVIEKTGGSKEALTQLLGSETAAATALQLMKEGGEAWAKTATDMANRTALVDEQIANTEASAKRLADNLKDRLGNRLKEVGTEILKGLVPALEFALKHVDALFALLGTTAAFVTFNAAFALASKAIKIFGLDALKQSGIAKKSFYEMAIAGETSAARLRLAFNGLGLAIIAGIVSYNLASAIYDWLDDTFPTFRDWASVLVSYAVEAVTRIGGAFAAIVTALANIREPVIAVWKSIIGHIQLVAGEGLRHIPGLKEAGQALIDFGQEDVGLAAEAMDNFVQTVEDAQQPFLDTVTEIQRYRGELRDSIDDTNEQSAAFDSMAKSAKRAADAATAAAAAAGRVPLSQEQLDAIKNVIDQDPLNALIKQREILEDLMASAANASNLDAGQLAEFQAVAKRKLAELGRSMEEAQIAVLKLAASKRPLEAFFDSIRAAADPAMVPLIELQDRVRELDAYLKAGILTPEQYAKAITLAAAAYNKAAREADPFINAVREAQATLDPAAAATEEYNAKLAEMQILLAGQPALLAAYTEQMRIQHEQQIKLIQLENDGLIQLTAQYDPLIKNELERAKALLQMQTLVQTQIKDERLRAQVMTEAAAVINRSYDDAADALTDNIRTSKLWEEAWRAAIERIDGMFVNLWRNAFSNTQDFTKQVKDLIKGLLAEMAHAAFTKPLVVRIGQMFQRQEPQPGQVFSQNVFQTALNRIGTILNPEAAVTEGAQVTVPVIAEGTYAALQRAGLTSSALGNVFGNAFDFSGEDPISAMARKLADFGVDIGSDLQFAIAEGGEALAATIEDAGESFADWAARQGVPGIAGTTLGNNPLTRGATAGAIAGTVGMTPQEVAAASGGAEVLERVQQLGGGLSGSLRSISGVFSTFLTSMQTMMRAFLSQGAHLTFGGAGAILGSPTAGGLGTLAGQGIAGGGLGLLSGGILNDLLGNRGGSTQSGLLSGIGGLVGSFFGPIGSLVGGAIGGFVSNILGGGSKLKDAFIELSVSAGELSAQNVQVVKEYGAFFSSSTRTRRSPVDDELLNALQAQFDEMSDYLENIADELGVAADAIKDFSLTEPIKIETKGKSPEEIQAAIESAMIELAIRQINAFIYETEGLSNTFVQLVQTMRYVQGETEEFIRSFELAAQFERYFNMGAFGVFEEARERLTANDGLTLDRIHEMEDVARQAAEEFDGTSGSLEDLVVSFVSAREAMIQFIVSINQVGKEVEAMFADTAQNIRESLMSPEELYNYRNELIQQQEALILTSEDPEEILRLSQSINALVNDVFNSLDEGQRASLGPGFLEFLEDVDNLVQDRLATLLPNDDELANFQSDIRETLFERFDVISGVMSETSNRNLGAANLLADVSYTFGAHVGRFGSAVNALMQIQTRPTPSSYSSGPSLNYTTPTPIPTGGGGARYGQAVNA